jgi:hypothetical protein
MAILALPVCMIAVLLCLIGNAQRRLRRNGGDDEFARAATLGRKAMLPGGAVEERRREQRVAVEETCTASVLGCEESRIACRILDVSRSGMRIALRGSFPGNAQVHVERGGEFFVGAICHSREQDGRQILGLRVVATNWR